MAFNWLKNAITALPRGFGQLLQGKPRGALGAFGDIVKPVGIAASAIPGPWQAAGIPLAAAGGAMQKFDDPGDRGFGDVIVGGVKGASTAGLARVGSGLVQKGISALQGATGSAVDVGTMPGTTVAPWSPTAQATGADMTPMIGSANKFNLAPSAVTSAVKPGFDVGSTVGGMATAGGLPAEVSNMDPSLLGKFGNLMLKKPEIPLGIASTAADVYGANIQGAAFDKQLELQRQTEKERQRQNELQMLLQAIASMTPRGSY